MKIQYDEVKMGRFHHDIEINENLRTSDLTKPYHDEHSFSSHKDQIKLIRDIYGNTLIDKTALSVACNGGAHLFGLQKYGIKSGYGFDVRKIWIDQANWLKNNITSYPVNNLYFYQHDIDAMPDDKLFDITFFDGIFYHLANPYMALAKMANITTEIMTVNTHYVQSSETKPALILKLEDDSIERGLSGVQRISWSPNGEEVIIRLLKHLGFQEFRLDFKTNKRLCVIASKKKGLLNKSL